jgi:hypothetical protein
VLNRLVSERHIHIGVKLQQIGSHGDTQEECSLASGKCAQYIQPVTVPRPARHRKITTSGGSTQRQKYT